MIKMPDIQSDTFWKRSHFVYELLSCVRLLIFTYSSYRSATISKGFECTCGMLDISILPSLHTRSQYCSMCEPTCFIIAIARIDRALITHMHARIHEPTSNEIGFKKYAANAASTDSLQCFGTANKYD